MRCTQCNRDESDCACPTGARARAGRPASGQGVLFDRPEGFRRKEVGMEVARAPTDRGVLLQTARRLLRAAAMGRASLEATADDAHEGLARIRPDYSPDDLGNAAGSLFRGKEWVFTGRREPSERPERHANENKVWRLDLARL